MVLVDTQVRSEGGKAENRESENGSGVGRFQNDLGWIELDCTELAVI